MGDFVRSLKYVGIIIGLIIILNVIGVSAFVLISEGWNVLVFLRFLLLYIMLEGLIMALVGSLSFFGFEKYRSLFGGEQATFERQQENEQERVFKDKSKLNLGVLLVSAGILLFFIGFTWFSFLV